MDFFAAQDAARKRSRWLTILFALAVGAMVLVVYVAVRVSMGVIGTDAPFVDPSVLLLVTATTVTVIGGGSVYRMSQLRAGGSVVAAMMGGRRIPPDTPDPDERRLINVVEEMSIAAGMPVPRVYVLDEEHGMNAFAAGYTTHDAAVAVTRGLLRTTTRDELQGVVAHEFSHILNGDMRLNIRLIGLLHGILVLALIGRGLLQGSRRRSSSRKGGRSVGLIGVALVLVGYVGVFFGKMIRAGISREREYLADAAAVQFTRNPAGLAGALKKVAGNSSQLTGSRVEEASHLLFVDGVRSRWIGFMATHPPLDERIRRIDPSWDGWLVPQALAGDEVVSRLAASSAAPRPRAVEVASALLADLPDPLIAAAHDRDGARALILALLLASWDGGGDEVAHRGGVLSAAGGLADQVLHLAEIVDRLGPTARVPLLDLSLPALDGLDDEARRSFVSTVLRAVRADGEVHLFEYTVAHVIARRLKPRAAVVHGREIRSFKPIRREVEMVISALARTGNPPTTAMRAFEAAAARLPATLGEVRLRTENETPLAAVDTALTRLEQCSVGVRRRFLEACAHCVAYDAKATPAELELLRAIAGALDCPMPPIAAVFGDTAADPSRPGSHPPEEKSEGRVPAAPARALS